MKAQATYNCQACRDSGWIVETNNELEAVVPCPECRKAKTTNKLLKDAGIPPRYFDRGLDAYFAPPGTSQEAAVKRAAEYIEAFPKVERGLLFAGPPGVGKTHLSVAILKALILEKGVVGKFIDETEFLRRLQYSYGPDSPETEREVLLPLMKVDLLVWDDLGTGRPTEWAMETIRTLLNHRYTYQKSTIFSTNWSLRSELSKPGKSAEASLEERIGLRLLSRILEMCEIITLTGPDARKDMHKARHDFEQAKKRADQIIIQAGRLECEKCRSISVEERGKSEPRRNKAGEYVDVFCSCKQCGRDFIARVYSGKNRVEYLKGLD